MRIGSLGWLRVETADGNEVTLGGVLERRVLAALVLGAGDVVSVDVLADAVFGERVSTSAAVRLQNHVSRLRKRLGAGTVITVPPGYRLHIEAVEVDWRRFEDLVVEATSSSAIDAVRAAVLLQEALALWRGRPFPDLEEWPPARTVTARLEELQRVAREEHASALIASGQAGAAVAALEALVAEDPLRERRWALLMLALYRDGRQADAQRAFQRARTELGEVGLEPGPELGTLERAISIHDESLQIGQVPTPQAQRPALSSAVAATTTCGRDARADISFIGSTLSISLLGPLEVTGPHGPIAVRGRRERAALAALGLRAGDVVSVEWLAEVVWGDDAPRSSPKVMQNLVLGLRKVLGSSTIETRPPGYVLHVDRDDIDVHRFDRLWHEGRACVAAGRPHDAFNALSMACSLWRGAPLCDMDGHTAGQSAAQRLREQYHDAMEELAEISLTLGRHHEWLPTLEAMVLDEPLRERRWGLLMLALHRCGRHAEALRAYQRARAALRGVGVEPGAELRALERRLAADDDISPVSSSAVTPQGNVARPLTSWIGPTDELSRRVAQLAARRLTTLTGPGGVGKTRLAIEMGLRVNDQFPGGVWFVDLAPLSEASAVVEVVAATIGAPARPATSTLDVIVDWFGRRRALMIVDNCEHVAAAVVALVAAVLTRCPTTTVLATSREPLDIAGEQVVLVPTMAPGDAYELFCERACAADDTIPASGLDRATIEEICARLDRIPLAIELAAGRMRSCTPVDVLARLDDRFALLQRGLPFSRGRHDTMRATVLWSYELLDETARTVFERASVFAGGFDADAARAVLAGAHIDPSDVDALLDELVRKAMVTADRRGEHVRYGMLETLRQFGQEQLEVRGERGPPRDRHLAHYLGVAQRAHRAWAGPRQADANAVFAREWNNLRAALRWAARADQAAAEALIAATAAYAESSRRFEHVDWARHALGSVEAGRAHPITYGWAAYASFHDFDYLHAFALAEAGVAAAERPDDLTTVMCRSTLVHVLRALGERQRAQAEATTLASMARQCTDADIRTIAYLALVEHAFWSDLSAVEAAVSEFAAWAPTVGAPSIMARAMFSEGRARMWTHEPADTEGALRCYTEGLRLARAVGDLGGENANALGLAFTHLHLCTPGAPAACETALVRLQESGGRRGVILLLDAIVGWLLGRDAIEPAALISGFLETPEATTGDRNHEAAGRLRTLRAQPGGTELLARGAALSYDEAVAYTLTYLAAVESGS